MIVRLNPSLKPDADHRPMKPALLALPFVLAIALVVYVEGSFNGFVVWNALPVLLGFGVLVAGRRARLPIVAGCTAFAVLATLPVVLFHLAWLFDWGGIATSSSTSALAFIFVPLWACVFAGIAGVLAWGVVRVVCKNHVAG